IEWELAAVPLVGDHRIGKPFANDDLASGEGGRDHPSHMVGSIRGHQKGFGRRIDVQPMEVQKEVPDPLPQLGATRFPGMNDGFAPPASGLDELLGLRRLAAAVDSFEGDENALQPRSSLAGSPGMGPGSAVIASANASTNP